LEDLGRLAGRQTCRSLHGWERATPTDACAIGSPAYVTDAIHYLVRLLYGVTVKGDALYGAFAAAGKWILSETRP